MFIKFSTPSDVSTLQKKKNTMLVPQLLPSLNHLKLIPSFYIHWSSKYYLHFYVIIVNNVYIITDRVRSTRQEVMFSVCPHLGGGVPRPGPDRGSTPARSRPKVGVPPSRDGVPPGQVRMGGTPQQGWGIPGQVRTGGYPRWGYLDLDGVPPPPPRYRTADGVLDTPRSLNVPFFLLEHLQDFLVHLSFLVYIFQNHSNKSILRKTFSKGKNIHTLIYLPPIFH